MQFVVPGDILTVKSLSMTYLRVVCLLFPRYCSAVMFWMVVSGLGRVMNDYCDVEVVLVCHMDVGVVLEISDLCCLFVLDGMFLVKCLVQEVCDVLPSLLLNLLMLTHFF